MPHWSYVTATAVFAAYLVGRALLAPSTSTTTTTYWLLLLVFVPAAWAFYAAFLVLVYPFFLSPFRDLPEPEGARLPWAHARFLRTEHNGAPFRRWIAAVPNEGIMRIRVLLNQERLFLTSPEAIRELQVTRAYDFVKPPGVGVIFRALIGNGLLVAEGAEHQRQRKALMPAFSYRHIKDLYPLFWDKSRHSVEEMAKASRSSSSSEGTPEPLEAYAWASRVTLDIIGVAGMGYDFNAVGDPDSHIVATYRALFSKDPPPLRWIVLGIRVPLGLLWRLPLPMFETAKAAASTIKAFLLEKVREKRRALEKGDDDDGMVDIMSVAMRSGLFGDDDVLNQMLTFLAAGHETTASALTWAVYLMCKHPAIQERLRAEIRASLPSPGDATAATITAADFDRLPYLHAVCNEVLRLIPSVPISPRVARVDTSLLGRHVPRGTYVLTSQWATNADRSVWGPTAAAFDPERWMAPGMANSGGARNNFANLTFLHGPRSCIGQAFSRAELAVLMAAWMGRFRVRWRDEARPLDMDVVGTVTLHPGHGLPVMFDEVAGW